MTVKETILQRGKSAEICEEYQDILISENDGELIRAGIERAEWAYRGGIIDDGLLAQLDPAERLKHHVYINETVTLENPTGTVHVFGTASVTIGMSGNFRCILLQFGSGSTVTANLRDKSFLNGKIFNGTFDLNQFDSSMSHFELTKTQNVFATIGDNSVGHFKCYEQSLLNLSASGNSYAKVQAFFDSAANETVNDAAVIDNQTTQQATINNNNNSQA